MLCRAMLHIVPAVLHGPKKNLEVVILERCILDTKESHHHICTIHACAQVFMPAHKCTRAYTHISCITFCAVCNVGCVSVRVCASERTIMKAARVLGADGHPASDAAIQHLGLEFAGLELVQQADRAILDRDLLEARLALRY